MQVETNIVLSAIRRGEDSLPKLRTATGLDYAKLHPILHTLEFEDRSIQRNENADGFDRYTLMPAERNGGLKGVDWKDEAKTAMPVTPQALHSTRAAAEAREMALLQRNAPYCVECRGLCVLHGTDRTGKIRWRCKPCGVTFAGSGEAPDLNRLAPEKRQAAISAFNEAKSIRQVAAEVGIARRTAAKIRDEEKIEALCPCGEDAKHKGWCSHRFQNSPARQATVEKMNMGHVDPETEMRERDTIGPEEERALANMRVDVDHQIGADEEAALDEMRGGELDEGEARIAHEIDRELAEAVTEDAFDDDGKADTSDLCGCGRPHKHGGRCSFRRQNSPSLADDLAAEKRESAPKNGRPRIEVDMQKLEDLLANPRLSITQVSKRAGIKRNLIYDRKGIDPEFDAAYERGMKRREEVIAARNGHAPKVSENITETITGDACAEGCDKKPEISADAKPLKAQELPAKVSNPTGIMQEIIPPMAQVQVMGGMKFREDVEIRLSEMRDWPAERVSEFFEALSKIIEIPHRPLPTKITPAWSPDFEGQVGDPEAGVGLTLCYLIGMLHHHMEPHEKEAVWTLVQYLKRMEAYVERREKTGAASD